jgi:hypothetical protein
VICTKGALGLGPYEVQGGRGKAPMASMPVPSKYRFVPEAHRPDSQTTSPERMLAWPARSLIDTIERFSVTGRSVSVS